MHGSDAVLRKMNLLGITRSASDCAAKAGSGVEAANCCSVAVDVQGAEAVEAETVDDGHAWCSSEEPFSRPGELLPTGYALAYSMVLSVVEAVVVVQQP